ncbi:MAG: TetR/AcrR family transcriptional regulator [Clostridiales bacterium]|jgi:AcrR family transcriptional regulator|nr:TetR/AcrR family transcriptional regulator [Clostridiales bacterium]
MPDRRIRKTDEAIKAAFFKLLKDEEYGRIGIKALCAEADINRATFYLHYDGLDQLFYEIEEDMICRFREFSERYKEDRGNRANLLSVLLEYIKSSSEQMIALLKCPKSDFLNALIADNCPESFQSWQRLYEYGSQADFSYCYEFVANGCVAMIKKWVFDGMKEDTHTMAVLAEKMMKQKR